MKINKEQIIEFMKELTDEERLKIIKSFCSECGSLDPRCQCWNDE